MPHRKKSSPQRQWRRVDLHLHTPASADYKQSNVTYLDLLRKAEERNLDIIAFTDHNTVAGYARYLQEIESLEMLERLNRLNDDERKKLVEYRRLDEKILILPGIEFTATLGFHILGIFPPETTVRELEHLLLLLRIPPDKLDEGSGEVGATSDALTAYRMMSEAGGLVIAAHANSSHGVAMPGFDFGGQTRIAYTQDSNLHALEVTDLDSKSRRRTAAFFSGVKPEYPRRMHCIQGSDAHKLVFDPKYKNEMGVGDRATEILIDDLSFDAIKAVFVGSDFSRSRPYRLPTAEPFDPLREAREQGDTLVQSFHERLREKRDIAPAILQDAVALANTNGGTIYIGASANARQAVVGVERPEQASSDLRGVISKQIAPPLEVQIEVLKSQGKSVLQVIVPRGSDAPYALDGTHIYVRSENETGLAMRDEIVQLVRDALAVELAAAAPPAPAVSEARPEVVVAPPKPPAEAPVPAPTIAPPRTGVEIVAWDVRKGVRHYSVRDLRNARVVQNVTLASARRLWQYAIAEQEKNPCNPQKVRWIGDIGICKTHKRGGKVRYDLVQRAGDKLFVYYGVTDDGVHGPWRALIEGEAIAEEAIPETLTEVTAPAGGAAEYDETAGLPTEPTVPPEVAPLEEMPELPPVSDEVLVSHEETHVDVLSAEAGDELVPPEVPPLASEESVVEQVEELPTPPLDELALAPVERVEEAAPPREVMPASETRVEEPVSPRQVVPAPETRVEEPAPPSAPKTRAQEWREILDRAMAEARAAQQTAQLPAPKAEEHATDARPQTTDGSRETTGSGGD
jgi:hypothetical protein